VLPWKKNQKNLKTFPNLYWIHAEIETEIRNQLNESRDEKRERNDQKNYDDKQAESNEKNYERIEQKLYFYLSE